MTIWGRGEEAYVQISKDTMLCIGKIRDLQGKPDSVVVQAIIEAVAIARFKELGPNSPRH